MSKSSTHVTGQATTSMDGCHQALDYLTWQCPTWMAGLMDHSWWKGVCPIKNIRLLFLVKLSPSCTKTCQCCLICMGDAGLRHDAHALPGSREIQQKPVARTLLVLVCHSIFTMCTFLYHFLSDLTTQQGLEGLSGLSTYENIDKNKPEGTWLTQPFGKGDFFFH